MKKRITNHKGLAVASVVALGAVLCAFALAFANIARPDAPGVVPPMTLTYEVYGPGVSVGNRSIPAFKEIRRLEYRGENDWTETVIESPTLDLGRYGEASNAGSDRTVKGNTETEHDAMDGSTSTYTLDGGGRQIPFSAFGYTHIPPGFAPIGGATTGMVAIDAELSIGGELMQNARAVEYKKGNRTLVMYEGNGFTIPVKNGDHFILKSAVIHGP